MHKRFRVKFGLIVVGMVAVLIFGLASSGIAGGGEPTAGKVGGTRVYAILSSILLDISGFPFVVSVITGECNGAGFTLGPVINNIITPDNIATVIADDLDDVIVGENIPGCVTGAVAIGTVRSFYNGGTSLGAEVILQEVIY